MWRNPTLGENPRLLAAKIEPSEIFWKKHDEYGIMILMTDIQVRAVITGSLLRGILAQLLNEQLNDLDVQNQMHVKCDVIVDVIDQVIETRKSHNKNEFSELLFDAPSAAHKVVSEIY